MDYVYSTYLKLVALGHSEIWPTEPTNSFFAEVGRALRTIAKTLELNENPFSRAIRQIETLAIEVAAYDVQTNTHSANVSELERVATEIIRCSISLGNASQLTRLEKRRHEDATYALLILSLSLRDCVDCGVFPTKEDADKADELLRRSRNGAANRKGGKA